MTNFEKINKLFGVRKTSDFYKPKMVDESEFVLPIKSAIIEYDHEYIGDKLYERTPKKSFVYVVGEYLGETSGTFRRLSITTPSIISNLKKKDDVHEFRFVTEKSKLWEVPNNKLILVDAYRVKQLYKYSSYPGSEYDEYMNRLSNAILMTREPDKITNRNIFLTIKIPRELPNMADIVKASKVKGYKTLAKYGKPDILVIFELIKAIQGTGSVFDSVIDKLGSDLVIVFTINGKISIVKYTYLLALNKDKSLDTPINGKSGKAIIKMFLLYLMRISVGSVRTLAELEKEQTTDVGIYNIEESDEEVDRLIEAHNDINAKKTISSTPKKTTSIETEVGAVETPEDKVKENLQFRIDRGDITQKIADKIITKAQATNEEIQAFSITDKDLEIDHKDYPRGVDVLDDTMLSNAVDATTKQFMKKVYHKQQMQAILGATGAGHVVSDVVIEEKRDASSEYQHITFSVMQPNGKTVKRKLIIPMVTDDGVIKMNGTRYKLRKQKTDIPIRKVDNTKVALSSYYSKVFISKAEINKNNSAAGIMKQLQKRVNDDVTMLLAGTSYVTGVELPTQYTAMSRKVRSLVFKGIFCSFIYDNRKDTIGDDHAEYGISFAKQDKTIYYISTNNIVTDSTGKSHGKLYDWLLIDESVITPEYANIYILGSRIPLVLVLIYYYGIDALLDLTKTSFKFITGREKYELSPREFMVKFADGRLVLNRDDKYASILFGAMVKIKELKDIEYDGLNHTENIIDLFFSMNLTSKLSVELNNLASLWVDPMTKTLLTRIKEPTTWKGLLLRSAELLLTDYAKNQNDISELLFKGYERLNGMVYNTIATAIRNNEHRVGNVTQKLDINPYEVIAALSEDSTLMLEADTNPLEVLKQSEEITVTGKFGRNKDAVSNKDKIYHRSNVGTISEATKDDKNVGLTVYLSASPNISDLLGTPGKPKTDHTATEVFSSSMALAPESMKDDGKRALYISIQNSHKRPTTSQRILPVRTGYGSVIPYRVGEKFVLPSPVNGTVEKVTKKSVTIIDENNKKHTFKMKDWTSKEESGLTFNHRMVTSLRVGDIITTEDIVYYDETNFGPDIFNRKRVLFKDGDIVRVAMDEAQEDYEDAGAISKAFSKRFSVSSVKVRTIILTASSYVTKIVSPGDNIMYDDSLMSFVDLQNADDLIGLTEKAKEIIADQSNDSPKAKVKGKMIKLEVYYNCELDSMSNSIRKIVEASDKALKESTGFTGRVDNTYSIKGKPLLEGELEFKFYIEKVSPMEISDKGVLINQLKFTVSKIMQEIRDEYGNEIDVKFGYKGIGARIVNSPEIIGTTMLILDDANNKMVNAYFG